MEKFSVKKPFTVLVMVVAILILGVVSLTSMTTDLLPEMSLPYMLVITTYPGASPEKVESSVCEPMESSLGSVSGVKNVYSMSYENYGIVELEFTDDTDMDSALVKVSSALDSVEAALPDECGTPTVMEISMDMMASVYLAVANEGMDIQETSRFVEDTVIPYLERQEGITSVSSIGLVENSVVVELNQEKVDALNDKILAKANEKFAEAQEQLDEAKQQLQDSEKTIADSTKELTDGQKELDDGKAELTDGKKKLSDGKTELQNKQDSVSAQLAAQKNALLTAKTNLETTQSNLNTAKMLHDGMEQMGPLVSAVKANPVMLVSLKSLSGDKDAGLAGCKDSYEQSMNDWKNAVAAMQAATQDPDNIDQNALDAATADKANAEAKIDALQRQIVAQKELISYLTQMDDSAQSAISPIMEMEHWYPSTTDEVTVSGVTSTVSSGLDKIQTLSGSVLNLLTQYNDLDTALTAITGGLGYDAYVEQVNAALAKQNIKDLDQAIKDVNNGLIQLEKGEMTASVEFANGKSEIAMGEYKLDLAQTQLDAAQEQLDSGRDSLKDAKNQIADGWDQYNEALEQYEIQKAEALRSANADQLLDINTLSSLIYAQNFAMPAGYIDDEDDNSWLLKIGSNFQSLDELSNTLLTHIDDIGDIYLKDVADITVIDNSNESYAKLDGNDGIILSIFKSSTAGTNEVSKNISKAVEELEQEYPSLSVMTLMDQGDYITLIIKGVLQSMIVGAILAILVLALFLKDVKPTLVVAVSIPLSVLTALILMYFSGISLNMMSLSGLALGIGMLVDNSIVVIENIYRLRSKGVGAARASVQGTRQVSGAIIASTLTTISVFAPMIFTTGTVRDLMMPISLTIIFTLAASLLIAMTVVPATGSTLLKNSKEKKHPWFEKIQNGYGKLLDFCLKVKVVPLGIAVALLAFSIWAVVRMGIVMIPDMTSNQIQIAVTMPEEIDQQTGYETADRVMNAIMDVDGVASVGAMAGGSTSLVASMSGSGSGDYTNYTFMVIPENENAGETEIKRICRDIEEQTKDMDCEVNISTGMEEMSTMMGSGLSIKVYGDDLDTLTSITRDIMDIVGSIDGYTDISNGQDEPDQVIHLIIDRDAAMKQGLTAAQIFSEINSSMKETATAATVTIDGIDMEIQVKDALHPVTRENLMDHNFEVKTTDDNGNTITEDHPLSEFATVQLEDGVQSIQRENQSRYMTVTASVEEGYNATLLSRDLEPLLENYDMPSGYSFDSAGESDTVNQMIVQMVKVLLLGLAFIYLVMVAQFQSLLSPFIVLFTVPLAFTGGLLGLLIMGEPLSVMGMMGFIVLLGTVVNNGIVFVDYTNQLRMGGLTRHDALIATGKTRMRPILMTALTTILAMASLLFGDDLASQMSRGMAIVVAGGLAYATLMTLFIIPVMYDILFKRKPLNVDIGDENLDDVPDDAADFLMQKKALEETEE